MYVLQLWVCRQWQICWAWKNTLWGFFWPSSYGDCHELKVNGPLREWHYLKVWLYCFRYGVVEWSVSLWGMDFEISNAPSYACCDTQLLLLLADQIVEFSTHPAPFLPVCFHVSQKRMGQTSKTVSQSKLNVFFIRVALVKCPFTAIEILRHWSQSGCQPCTLQTEFFLTRRLTSPHIWLVETLQQ